MSYNLVLNIFGGTVATVLGGLALYYLLQNPEVSEPVQQSQESQRLNSWDQQPPQQQDNGCPDHAWTLVSQYFERGKNAQVRQDWGTAISSYHALIEVRKVYCDQSNLEVKKDLAGNYDVLGTFYARIGNLDIACASLREGKRLHDEADDLVRSARSIAVMRKIGCRN